MALAEVIALVALGAMISAIFWHLGRASALKQDADRLLAIVRSESRATALQAVKKYFVPTSERPTLDLKPGASLPESERPTRVYEDGRETSVYEPDKLVGSTRVCGLGS